MNKNTTHCLYQDEKLLEWDVNWPVISQANLSSFS